MNWWIPSLLSFTRSHLYSFIGTIILQVRTVLDNACTVRVVFCVLTLLYLVLLYCWHSYVTTSPPGIFFVVMNYSVHATMYGYYFLMAMKWRPKWFNPVFVTIAQISQMVVGVAVTLIGFYYFKTDSTCNIQKQNNMAAFIMYGSYLFLFLQFFIGRYYKGQVKVVPKKKTV